MRISDWSSDVCSSDLQQAVDQSHRITLSKYLRPCSAGRQRILRRSARDAIRAGFHRAREIGMRFSSTILSGAALVLAGVAAGGCTPLRSHPAYVVDVALVNSVQPGVDTREYVLSTLGPQTFTSQLNTGSWSNLARDPRHLAHHK